MTMGVTKSKKTRVPQKSKLKKDPGIPKLPDLKVRKADKQRAKMTQAFARTDSDSVMASEPTLASLMQQAEALSSTDPSSSSSFGKTKEQVRRHYLRTLHKVIDESDIVILVLDARDPEGCRSRLVEEEVRRRESEGKKLVFVLNKVDLIPRSNAQAWLKYLRHSTPTLPFLSPSSAQHQKSNISSSTAPALLKLLKAFKPKAGTVTIGVVGYPNVGKSSLINSLKRSKVCAVAAQPGHTKDLQSVQLERGMKIVDSPGVVFDDDDEEVKGQKKGSVLLRNVVKVEDVDDPIAVVEEILLRTGRESIRKIYNLPEYSNTVEFLTMLALNSGRLLKGGTPDVTAAARHVLTDWNHQKIPYFSIPPAVHPSLVPSTVPAASSSGTTLTIAPGAENVGQAQILNSLSKPFELDGLFTAADAGAFGGGSGNGTPDVEMNDEETFYDANDTFEMEVTDDEVQMQDASFRSSLGKRPRSPSPPPPSTTPDTQSIANSNSFSTLSNQLKRQPKRLRKSKEIPSYDSSLSEHILSQMERGNPLNRRILKKDKKKERKAMRAKMKALRGDGMEVDSLEGLEFTFMA